jgi:hypothetical protein
MASSRIRPGATGPEEAAEAAKCEAPAVESSDVDVPDDMNLPDVDLPESGSARVILSRKELARHYRQQAYQKAKAWRAQDPKHLALKEAVKVRRREAYQEVKARRKAADSQEKAQRAAKQAEGRQAAKKELGSKLRRELKSARQRPGLIDLESALDSESAGQSDREVARWNQQSDLQSELQSAFKNKRVVELMQRVRLASEDASIVANSVFADTVTSDEAYSSSDAVPSSQSRRATRGAPD